MSNLARGNRWTGWRTRKPSLIRPFPSLRMEELEVRDVPATTFTWTGGSTGLGASNLWSNPANWSTAGGPAAPTGNPANVEDLVFPAGAARLTNVDDIANGTFNSITFGGGGYDLQPATIAGSPNTMTLLSSSASGTVVVQGGAAGNTLEINTTLGAAAGSRQTFTINSGGDLTVTGRLSGTTGTTLTKDGAGALKFTADNSGFTGPIELLNNAGVLVVTNPLALGDTTSGTKVGTNSALQLSGVVGTINESLILNGLGGTLNDGALLITSGTTTWAGPIRMDTASTLGASSGTVLTVTGVISDLTQLDLTKEGQGEIQFNPTTGSNLYRGQTLVNDGVLTVMRPLALGLGGTSASGTVVSQTPTKTGQLRLDGTAVGGFTVLDEVLTLNGAGANGLGSLSNTVGNNQWAGSVILGSPAPTVPTSASIGAASGTNLTISGVISSPNQSTFGLVKVGAGRLILNNANTYAGPTTVGSGALNIRDSQALGSTAQGTTVSSGAALELEVEAATLANQTDPHGRQLDVDSVTGTAHALLITEPITLNGSGIGNTGALRSVSGINEVRETININGTVAVGVDADQRPNHPSPDQSYFTSDYSLTVTGSGPVGNPIAFAISPVFGGSIVKRGLGQLILPSRATNSSGTAVQEGWVTVQNVAALGATASVSSGAALHIKPTNPAVPLTFSIPLSLSGTGITHPYSFISQKGALMNLAGSNVWAGDITLASPASGIGVEQIDASSGAPVSDLVVTGAIKDPSNAPAVGGGLVKLGSKQLTLEWYGTYTGANDIREGTLLVRNDTALGLNSSGTFNNTQQTYTDTTTTVQSGAVLQLQGTTGLATLNGGTQAGLQVWNEHLVLNSPAQQVTVAGVVNVAGGHYRLTFNGNPNSPIIAGNVDTTDPIPVDASAAELQAKLNAVATVQAAGGVSVTKSGNVYTVVFGVNNPTGATHAPNVPLMAVTTNSPDGDAEVRVSGGNAALVNVSDDTAWRGPVTLNQGTRISVAANSRLTIFGAIDDASNPSPAGSDLVLREQSVPPATGGELALAGASSYRGTTWIDQGIVTALSSQAFGTSAGGTVVANGAQLQLQGGVTVAGEPLTVQGSGVDPANMPTFPVRWLNIGPAPADNGQAPLNVPTSGRVTSVAVDPSNSSVIYIATAGGGVWKTRDGGYTWQPLFDTPVRDTAGNPVDTSAVMFGGSITMATSSVIYFATGDSNGGPNGQPISQPSENYAGSGVYKSTDGGATWTLLTNADTTNPLFGQEITKVVVDPSNANRIYVASGTVNVRNADPNAVPGVWRYDTTGVWYNMTADTSVSASRKAPGGIAGQAPFDTFGPPGTTGPDDDYRIRFPQSNATWSDLAIVNGVLFAALGESTEKAFTGPAPAGQAIRNAVYRVPNPTVSNPRWFLGITPPPPTTPPTPPEDARLGGFPLGTITNTSGPNGYIKLAGIDGVTSTTSTIYAAVTDPTAGSQGQLLYIQKSTDGGQTWTATAGVPTAPFGTAGAFLPALGRYDMTLLAQNPIPNTIVDNQNSNVVYLGGKDSIFRTADGGATWTALTDPSGNGPAGNFHALALNNGGTNLFSGSDGGIWRFNSTTSATSTFNDLNGNLSITSLNSVDPHPTDLTQALAGAADIGTVKYGSSTSAQTGNNLAWQTQVTGAAGFNTGVVRYNQADPTIAYAARDGILYKSNDGGASWTAIKNVTNTPTPILANNAAFNYFPLVVDKNRILVGGQGGNGVAPLGRVNLQESTNGGASFTELNPGIGVTAIGIAQFQGTFVADPGFPAVTDKLSNTSDLDTIYVTNGTSILVTKNHGITWLTRNPTTLPVDGRITDIAVDPSNRDTVFITVSIVKGGTTGSRVYRSTNAGQTWTDISGTGGTALPNIPTWRVIVDPRPASASATSGTIYVGNDNGVWQLDNAAATGTFNWTRVGVGMPMVQVRDLALNQTLNTLTAATNGRGAFQMILPNHVANSGALRAVSGASVWTGPVTLAGNTTIGAAGSQQVQNGITPASVNIIGAVSDAPGLVTPPTVTKLGLGTVTLSGANTYAGQTLVQEGILQVNNPQALGLATGNTLVSEGAALEIRSDLELEPITINGNGIVFPLAGGGVTGFNGHFTGALRNVSGDNVYTGPLTLGTSTNPANVITIGVDSGTRLTIGQKVGLSGAGTVTDLGSGIELDKELTGTLALADANNYLGVTRIRQGAIQVQANGALGGPGGAGTVVMDGAQLQISRNGFAVASGAPVYETTVTNEALTLSGAGLLGTGALLNVRGDTNTDPAFTNNNTWAGPITLTVTPNTNPTTFPGSQVSFGVADSGIAGVRDILTIDSVITPDAAIAESFGLIKVGPGVLALNKANTYTGVTNVREGTIRVRNNNALGTTGTPNSTSNEVQTVSLVGQSGTYSLTIFGQTANLNLTDNAATVQAALQALTRTGPGNVQVAETVGSNGKVLTITFQGAFAGLDVPQLVAVATGVPPLPLVVGVSTAQPGGLGTVVDAGAGLELDDSVNGSLSVAEALSISGTGANGEGALNNVRGVNTYAGPVTLAADTAIGAAAGTQLNVTGGIQSPTPLPVPDVNLRKVGTGTVVLPTANSYGGTTNVDAGILQISNANALGTGRNEVQTVTAYGGFTLTFNGQTTAGLSNASSAAAVQAALNALSSISGPEIQTVRVGGVSGSFTLTFRGQTTGALTFSGPTPPSAAAVQAALNAPSMTNIAAVGGVIVTSAVIPGGDTLYTVTFNNNPAVGEAADLPQITAGNATGTAVVSTATVQDGVGGSVSVTSAPVPAGTQYTITFGGSLANTNVPQITSDTGFVATRQDGLGAEVQKVTATATSGTFALSFQGQTTAPLAFNANAGDVQAALNALSTIGRSEVQAVQVTGTGTFRLNFNGQLTNPIAVGAPAATVQTELNNLLNVGAVGGSVVVTSAAIPGGGTLYTVTFGGTLANTDFSPMSFATVTGTPVVGVSTVQDGSSVHVTRAAVGGSFEYTVAFRGGLAKTDQPQLVATTLSVVVATTQPGGPAQSEIQTVDAVGSGGTFTLTFNGSTTPTPLAFNALDTDVQAALEGLPRIGVGNVSVTRTAITSGFRYTVSFINGLANTDVPQLIATPAGVSFATVQTIQNGPGGTTVNTGATLQLASLLTSPDELVTINGPGFNGIGALNLLSGTAVWSVPLILGSNATIGTTGALDHLIFTAPISDGGNGYGVTIVGPGTVQYASTGTASYGGTVYTQYTGSTTVNNGNLLLSQPTGGAVLGALFVGDGVGGAATAVVQATFNDQVADASTVTVAADGKFDLNGKTDTISDLTVNGGQVYTGAGGVLTTGAVSATGGLIDVGDNAALHAAGVTLTAASSITGHTNSTVTAADTSLDASAISFLDDGELDVAGLTATATSSISFGDNGTLDATGDVSLTASSVSFGDDGSFSSGNLSEVLGSLLKFLLRGALNAAGVALDTSSISMGANGTGAIQSLGLTAGSVSLGTGTTLGLNGNITASQSNTQSSVAGPGATVALGATARTVSVADGTQDVDLKITTGLTGAGLVKSGTGRLELGAAGFTGQVDIGAGDVQVDAGTSTGPVNLTGGSLSGAGTVGAVTATPVSPATALVSPGVAFLANPAGILTTGPLAWNAQTTFFVNLANTTSPHGAAVPGTDYDQLAVTGNINLGGAKLDGTFGTGIQLNDQFTIITYTGTRTGKFALNNGKDQVFIGGQKFNIVYDDAAKTVVLEKVLADATIGITSSANPSTLNQSVTFTATVTPETGSTLIPGTTTVTFSIDGVDQLPAIPVGASGVVTLSHTFAPGEGGSHTIAAHFSGNPATFNPSDTPLPDLVQVVEVPTIDPLPAGPLYVSPQNSPGVQDTLPVSTTVRSERGVTDWWLDVYAAGGSVPIRTIHGQTDPAPGNSFVINTSWDGKDGSSAFVAAGNYEIAVRFQDPFGNTGVTPRVTVVVDNTNPTTTGLTNSNSFIAPGTGLSVPVKTTLTSTVGDAVALDHWTLTITPQGGGAPVKTFTGTGTAVNQDWDGTNAGNVIVPDGVYTATLTVFDKAGNSVSAATQTIAVLTHPPTVTISPTTATVYGQSITLTATVSLPAGFPTTITDQLIGLPVHFFNGATELAAGTPHLIAKVGGAYTVSITVPSFNVTTVANPNLITAKTDGTSQFLAGTSAPVQQVVTPAALTVTATSESKVYGTPPTFAFTFSPLVNGDTAAVFSGSPAATPAQPTPIPVGSYTIGQGTLTAGPNYTITFNTGTLTVTKAPLTVVVNDAVRAEGAANPAFTAQFQGLVAGDSAASIGLNLTTTATAASGPGRYPIVADPAPNPANYTVTVTPGVLTVTPIPTDLALGSGSSGQVNLYTPAGQFRSTSNFFGAGFTGGVRTATADFNRDGVTDLLVGTGPGVKAEIVVVDGATGNVLFDEFPFDNFTGGVFVAAGDINKDGFPEVVVTPDQGGGPRVRIYNGGNFAPLVSYFGIDDPNFRGGARAGVGDLNGDGYADVVVSAGFEGGPRISTWDGKSIAAAAFKNLTLDFFAFDPSLRNGAYVTIGDVNNDGFGDLIAGAGPGGGPAVKVFDGKTLLSSGAGGATVLASFFAGDPKTREGVRVAAKSIDGDAFADIVTGDVQSGVAAAYLGKDITAGTVNPFFTINDFAGVNGGVYVG